MNRSLTAATLALSLAAAVNASPVGVYINDDFATLDTAVWDTTYHTETGGNVYAAGSYVNVKAGSGWTSSLASKTALTPASEDYYVKMTTTMLGYNDPYGYDDLFGLSSNPGGAGQDAYLRMVKYSSSNRGLYAYVNNQTYKLAELGTYNNFDFTIIWTPSYVQFLKNDVLWFDTRTTTPIEGGSWTIPAIAMKAYAITYNNSETISADRIKFEVVPEPAMASLAMLGAAAFGLRRRRG